MRTSHGTVSIRSRQTFRFLSLSSLRLIIAGCLLLWASNTHAQTQATIKGLLLDTAGQPVSQATIRVLELGRSAVTDTAGRFEFMNVPRGTYLLVVETESWALDPYSVTVGNSETAEVYLIALPGVEPLLEEVTVTARADDMIRIATSGSQGVTGQVDLQSRPILRTGELLETVPGMIATQHSGGGKANQYFVRGFNLDHGTDFAVTVDGIPANYPTHAHGQGYLDLNFVIPELVEKVAFRKGLYYAKEGDFSAAGSASFSMPDKLDDAIIKVVAGEYNYGRALLAGSTRVLDGDLLAGLELYHYDGPWESPDNFRKTNAVLRFSRQNARAGFRLAAQGYDGRWNASDHIPQRAVVAGTLSRFGFVDPTSGGDTSRYSLSGEYWRTGATSITRLRVYGVRYDLTLYSNFTYALEDPENGDQFEQRDHRWMAGVTMEHRRVSEWWGRQVDNTLGFQLRNDWIDNGLFWTRQRQRLSTTREDGIAQLGAAPFAESQIVWNEWLRTTAGLRVDLLNVNVESNNPLNSGDANGFLVSPKLSVALGPWRKTEIYGNFGGGFHSNDARGATISVDPNTGAPMDRVPALVRAWGFDLGFRTQAVPRLHTSATFFGLGLGSELVFVGDGGGTEASRPSRRWGLELADFYQPVDWLKFDFDIAFSRARFHDDDTENRIAGAMEKVLALGVTVDSVKRWSGSIRWRYFGSRPLVEDDSVRAEPSSLVNARIGCRFRQGVMVGVEVFNLFNSESNDIDYYYTSRLPGEPRMGVEDIHFHPAESRSFRLFVDWRL